MILIYNEIKGINMKYVLNFFLIFIIAYSGYQIHLDNSRPEAIIVDTGTVIKSGCVYHGGKNAWTDCRADINFKKDGIKRLSLSFSVLEGDTIDFMVREEYHDRKTYSYYTLAKE